MDESFDQFSVILDQLLNLNELSFEAISSYNRANSYIRTKEGMKDFITSLPYIVELRSPSINLLAQIVKDFIISYDNKKIRKDIKNQIFYTFFHLPSKSPSKFHDIDPKQDSNSNTIQLSKSFSNAYFFRCLYDLSIYTVYEIANLIHRYWEIDSAVSSKSKMTKYSHKMPLISLFVWFAPEIDFVNNSFFNLLYKIARKELFSRKLPKAYGHFIENIEKYRENGKWSYYKEKMKRGENENEILKYIKVDDCESLRKIYYNKSIKKGTKPNKNSNSTKNDKSSHYIANLNNSIEAHLFNTHWLLQYSPTPLHIAAFFGASECVEFLISEVVDSNGLKKKDKLGLDVVDFAGVGGNAEVIKILRNHELDIKRSIRTSVLFQRNHLSDFISREFGINMKTFYPEMCASNNISAFKNIKKITENEESIDLMSLVEISARFGSFLLIRENVFDLSKQLLEMALLTAVKYSNLRYIECLLSYVKIKNLSIPEEFDINKVDEDGETALQFAVGLSDFEIARTLILSKELFDYDFKINLNVKLPNGGQSLLHTCVLLNSIEIAKILLNSDDFDVNITDCSGATPLHYASRCVNTIGTHLVVDLSIVKEEFVRKPENYIFSYGKYINLEMFQLFVRTKRVNFNVFDNYGMAPLHYVAKGGRVDYIYDIRLNRMKQIDPESPIPTSTEQCFKYVQRESTNYNNIISKSSNSNESNSNLTTQNENNDNDNDNDNESNIDLTNQNENNDKNNESNTDLTNQNENNDNDNESNINLTNQNENNDKNNESNSNLTTQNENNDNDNESNINLTNQNENNDKNNESNSNLTNQNENNDKNNENNINSTTQNNNGNSNEEGKVFISDVDFRIKSKNELKNPLHYSAENDRVSNCSALMSFVSDSLNDRDINGRTPIQLACAAGCIDCIRYLLEFATPEIINARDKWEKTALHISSSKGRTGCVRQLAQLENIDLNCKDSCGNTALRLADNHLYYLTSQLLEFVNAEK